MQTLAEYLGVPQDGKSATTPLEEIADGKEFGLAVMNSLEFRRYVLDGLRLGNLPGFASILGRLMDHAIGKAPDRVEVRDTTVRPEQLTAEQLEARAMRLAEMARFLRRAEEFDEPLSSESVH